MKEIDPAHDGLPSVGDILSFAGTKSKPNGHTSIVTAIAVTGGKGSQTTMEQNASSTGVGSVAVANGVVSSGVTRWLHNPNSVTGGGGSGGAPVCPVSMSDGHIQVFEVAISVVQQNWFCAGNGAVGGWTQSAGLGAQAVGDPAVMPGSGKSVIDIFVRGGDNQV